MQDRVRCRINRTAYMQYMKRAREINGWSERELARQANVSHTLLQSIRRDRAKRYVDLDTAGRIEQAFGAPGNLIFLPEVSTVDINAGRKTA